MVKTNHTNAYFPCGRLYKYINEALGSAINNNAKTYKILFPWVRLYHSKEDKTAIEKINR
ncbi:hypothetical protein wCauATS_10450 [Wolbachia pipientis]|uniref:Transposase n=1 Tax=Wolbachia endosymbiont of Sergentomyia squamirostris TaxID=3113640 RepID=A0AAT9GC85_9RICK|nr:hypothetical protein WANA13_0195 [Wolbachia endosymbiont of Drosophila ananassae]BEP32344.1 MAG: hypothetical protein WBIAU2_05710 [Wolbachia endosymbiont of Drosophila biauraria]